MQRDLSPKRAPLDASIDAQNPAVSLPNNPKMSSDSQEAVAVIDSLFPNTNPKVKERLLFLARLHLPIPDAREKLQLPFLEFLAKVYKDYPTLEFGQSIATADASADFLIKLARAIFLPDRNENPYAGTGGPPAPASQRQ